jgi:hypothetical protein
LLFFRTCSPSFRNKAKEGNPFEEEYLIETLEAMGVTTDMCSKATAMIKAFLFFGKNEQAREIQACLSDYRVTVEASSNAVPLKPAGVPEGGAAAPVVELSAFDRYVLEGDGAVLR